MVIHCIVVILTAPFQCDRTKVLKLTKHDVNRRAKWRPTLVVALSCVDFVTGKELSYSFVSECMLQISWFRNKLSGRDLMSYAILFVLVYPDL